MTKLHAPDEPGKPARPRAYDVGSPRCGSSGRCLRFIRKYERVRFLRVWAPARLGATREMSDAPPDSPPEGPIRGRGFTMAQHRPDSASWLVAGSETWPLARPANIFRCEALLSPVCDFAFQGSAASQQAICIDFRRSILTSLPPRKKAIRSALAPLGRGYCGPSDRSAAQGDLCHEAPAQPITQPNRPSATGPIDTYPGGTFLHWRNAPAARPKEQKSGWVCRRGRRPRWFRLDKGHSINGACASAALDARGYSKAPPRLLPLLRRNLRNRRHEFRRGVSIRATDSSAGRDEKPCARARLARGQRRS